MKFSKQKWKLEDAIALFAMALKADSSQIR